MEAKTAETKMAKRVSVVRLELLRAWRREGKNVGWYVAGVASALPVAVAVAVAASKSAGHAERKRVSEPHEPHEPRERLLPLLLHRFHQEWR